MLSVCYKSSTISKQELLPPIKIGMISLRKRCDTALTRNPQSQNVSESVEIRYPIFEGMLTIIVMVKGKRGPKGIDVDSPKFQVGPSELSGLELF